MNLDTFLAIASFTMAAIGLASQFLPPGKWRKETILTVAIGALLATTGAALYVDHEHEALLTRVEVEIIEALREGPKTFDELYELAFPRPFATVSEALFGAVEMNRIEHELIEMRTNSKPVKVRHYFLIP